MFMSFELESRISGKLVKNSVRIENLSMQNILLSKGFGQKSEKEFFLNSYESLYLVYTKRLKIMKGKKIISFDYLLEMYQKIHDDIFTKFLIYRDLRNRGYIVKNGFGFGSDFLVYEKGQFGQKGAKYLIFAMNEGTQEKISHIQKKIEHITKMGKEPVIAVIERRGEAIYYKISKIDFLENKKDVSIGEFNF